MSQQDQSHQFIPGVQKLKKEAKAIKKAILEDGGQAKTSSIHRGQARAWGFENWQALEAADRVRKPFTEKPLNEKGASGISAGLYAFFLAEIENELHGGDSPTTLDSALGSLYQMPEAVFVGLNSAMALAGQNLSQVLNELKSLIIDLGGNFLAESLVLQYESKNGVDGLQQPILPMCCIAQSVDSSTGSPRENIYEVPFDAAPAIASLEAVDIARLVESDWTDVDVLWQIFQAVERKNTKLLNARTNHPTVEILLADEIDSNKASEWVMEERPEVRAYVTAIREGWTVNPDPDQEGMFYYKNPDQEGSDISYPSEEKAWKAVIAQINEEPVFIRVEHDLSFSGGDYDRVGSFTFVPVELCDLYGVEEAFEKYQGVSRQHIIHYSEDELYNFLGDMIGEEDYDHFECANCGFSTIHEDEFKDISQVKYLSERVEPGGPMPAGECLRCGALVYKVDK